MYVRFVLFMLILLFLSCDKQLEGPQDVYNPLDAANPETGGDPFRLSAAFANGGLKLSWNIPDVAAISQFNVYRSENETQGYSVISHTPADDSTYIDKTIANGHSYWYRVTAGDKQGNESRVTNTVPINIKTKPLLVINGGAQYTSSREVSLTILAITATKMMISNNVDFSGAAWESYATSKGWTLPIGEVQKTVYMKVKYDSTESEMVQTSIRPQPINPSIAILADTTQYTPTRDVQLTLSAAGSNLQMKLSEDSTFNGVNWQAFSSNTNFQLSTDEGAKKVFAVFKNDFEIESSVVNDEIIMDTTPPTIALTVSPDSGITGETNFQFDPMSSSDNLSPVQDSRVRYDYENDGSFDTGWEALEVGSKKYEVGGGNKTIKMQLKDGAGWQVETTKAIFVNTRPQASFTATENANNLKLWHFDASASSDYEDGHNLQYRWDFDGDGAWDTSWLTRDTVSYVYANDGDFNARLSVRDQHGLTAEQTVQVSVPSMTDQDGNVYRIVKIGDQWWMAENLKVMHYRNGDAIPNVTDATDWTNLSTGAYCAYNNDNGNIATYGLLYNWYAVDDSRHIAPEGWHVPTDAEWTELENYLGSDAGGKLKEAGTSHWNSPNTGATNESGFSALPGGYRHYDGASSSIGYSSNWWSSTAYSSDYAWYRHLSYFDSDVDRIYRIRLEGFSVRLVRD